MEIRFCCKMSRYPNKISSYFKILRNTDCQATIRSGTIRRPARQAALAEAALPMIKTSRPQHNTKYCFGGRPCRAI